MEVTKHEPGMFSWADLGTPDAEGAKRFYTELLELDATDMPMGEGMSYSMLSKRGKNSCALYTMPDEMAQMTGGRPAWLSYFTVESADETAPRITELGGTVVNGPFDVFTSGRMVVAMDPTGAMFAAWEPRDHIGAGIFGEPGALAWNELYTHDTEAAASLLRRPLRLDDEHPSRCRRRGLRRVPAGRPVGGRHDGDQERVGRGAVLLVDLFLSSRPRRLARKGQRSRGNRSRAANRGTRRGQDRAPAGPPGRPLLHHPDRPVANGGGLNRPIATADPQEMSAA